MTNHRLTQYKPGLTLDKPVSVTLAAADWLLLMNWFGGIDNDGAVRHIVYGAMSPQIQAALYTPASISALEAYLHEAQQPENHPVVRFMQSMPFPGMMDMEAHRCPNCGRVAGAPTAPCSECEDFQ